MPAQITVQLPQIGVSPSRDDPDFDDHAEDMMGKMQPLQQGMDLFAAQANALALDVNIYAQSAEQSAAAAAQAALAAGAELWVSGRAYNLGDAVVDPVSSYTYRKRTATSASNNRPALDRTNWKNISVIRPSTIDESNGTGTFFWDADLGEIAKVTLSADRTISLPTNMAAGTYVLHLKQDATGGRKVTFAAGYNFPDNVAPEIDARPGYRTVFSFISDGVELWGTYIPGFAK